jgi:hypothetical protein
MLAFGTAMATLTRLSLFAPNQVDAHMPTYKILSLHGGGIRGVFTAALIKKLHDATQFLDAVDVFAGTSTGALLALALAAPRGGSHYRFVPTGINHEYITSPATLDWGVVNWAPYLVDLFMDGPMGVVEYQCTKLLGDRYRRLAPALPGNKAIKLEDTSAVEKLLSYAETISETESFTDLAVWVKKRFK